MKLRLRAQLFFMRVTQAVARRVMQKSRAENEYAKSLRVMNHKSFCQT
jgi:hypothetical protein